MYKTKIILIIIILCLFRSNFFAQCPDSVQIELTSNKDDGDPDFVYSNKYIRHFTSTGKKTSEVLYQFYTGIWIPAYKILYFYDLNDSLIRQTELLPVDTGWANSTQSLFTFNASGKLIYFNSQKWDGLSWIDMEHKTYSYDVSDNLINVWNEKNISGTWINLDQVFYFYDNFNNDTLEIYQKGDSSSWKNFERIHFTYDIAGLKIYQLTETWNSINSTWAPQWQTFYTYNGNLIDSALTQFMNVSWQNDNLHIYTYSPFGQVIRDSTFRWTNPDWLLYELKINDVDAFGYPSFYEEFYCNCNTPVDCDCDSYYGYYEYYYDSLGHYLGSYSDPIPGGDGSSHYTYDSNWILIHESHSSTSMGGLSHAGKTDYYYNEIHGPLSICSGSNTILSVDSCPGYTYLWNTGATTSSIVADTAGTYTVNVTYPNGFQTYTEPFTLYIDPIPPQFTFAPDSIKNICANRALSLQGSLFPTVRYQWYRNDTAIAGANGTSIYYFGINLIPGTYYLVAYNTCGSDTSAKTTVNILPAPVAIITASGPLTFCNGGSVILTAAPGISYSWNTGQTTQQITATSSGSRTVYVTNASGCRENSTVYVNTIVYPQTPQIIQSGIDLQCTSSANYYQWLLNGDTIPGATSVNYTPTIQGDYSVICAYFLLCPVYSNTYHFEFCSASINAASTVTCSGNCDGTISVTCNGIAPYSYSWSTADTTPTIANLCAGTYVITITDSQSCTATDSITITNDSLAIDSIISSHPTCIGCSDGEIIINAINLITPFYFTWTPQIGNITGNTIYDLPAGNYQVCVGDGNGCVQCDSVTLADPNISVALLPDENKLIIYPNPVNNFLTIEFPKIINEKSISITIYNELGKEVLNEYGLKKIINVESLSKGLYMIKIIYNENICSGLFIKE